MSLPAHSLSYKQTWGLCYIPVTFCVNLQGTYLIVWLSNIFIYDELSMFLRAFFYFFILPTEYLQAVDVVFASNY